MKNLIFDTLKNIPIDLGQANLRFTTKGKLIAQEFIENGEGRLIALDIGCREGAQSRLLESRGYQVTSIDIEKVYDKCNVVDVNDGLPFEDDYFDLVWCSEVIEHLKEPESFAQDVRRVLKPNGQLLLTTPNSCFWLYPFLKIFGISAKEVQNPNHLHFFNKSDIDKIFPDGQIFGYFPYLILKFRIKSFIGFLSPTFVVRLLKK